MLRYKLLEIHFTEKLSQSFLENTTNVSDTEYFLIKNPRFDFPEKGSTTDIFTTDILADASKVLKCFFEVLTWSFLRPGSALDLNKLINLYSTWNNQKTIGFLREYKGNTSYLVPLNSILLILETKFGDDLFNGFENSTFNQLHLLSIKNIF